MSDFTVIWDGRRNGPGGALLFGDEPDTRPASPAHRLVKMGHTERVRFCRDQLAGWFSHAEAARVTGLASHEVGVVLSNLIRQGQLERLHRHLGPGRHADQRYRWVTR